MARQIQPSRSRVRQLRRLWPYVLMAWERWQQLSPEEKERYKKQARDYAERGRKTIEERRKRRPPKRR
jgi:glycogen debranching enzyme